MTKLNRIITKLKSGEESFSFHGKKTACAVLDFWRWSASDLVSNATRGRLAEFIVSLGLRLDIKGVRNEWQAYDLETKEGIKIEVKSAAYVQSWAQENLSKISFSIKTSRYWDANSNKLSAEIKRQADIYVFCLLEHKDKSAIDPLKLEQWLFFVVARGELDNYKGSQNFITLKNLQKLAGPGVAFDKLREAVNNKCR